MFCQKCGIDLGESQESLCPECKEKSLQLEIKDYTVYSVLSMVFCCVPFGVVSLIYSSKSAQLVKDGKTSEAMEMSQKAKTWAIAAAITGFILTLIYITYDILSAILEVMMKSEAAQ